VGIFSQLRLTFSIVNNYLWSQSNHAHSAQYQWTIDIVHREHG